MAEKLKRNRMRYSALATVAAGLAAAFALGSPAEALDRRVRIVNASSHDIVAFHGVSVDTREWHDSLHGLIARPFSVILGRAQRHPRSQGT
jgi:hypothetical protein